MAEVKAKVVGSTFWIGDHLITSEKPVEVGADAMARINEAQENGLFAFEIAETPEHKGEEPEDKEDTKEEPGEISDDSEDLGIEFEEKVEESEKRKPLSKMNRAELEQALQEEGIEYKDSDTVPTLRKLLGE